MITSTQSSRRSNIIRRAAISIVAVSLIFALLPCDTAHTQAKKPINKDGLLKAIRLNGLSTPELVQQITLRGVAFNLTPEIEAEMRNAGARPEVIAAARRNYRAQSAPRPFDTAENASPAPPINAASLPLSKAAIITALQTGSPPDRVAQMIAARGVDFKINPQVTREINLVGGTRSLIKAIGEHYKRSPDSMPVGVSTGNTAPAPDYDDLTDMATNALQERNAYRAKQLLLQAINLDSSQPRAYQLLGFNELYGNRDFAAAEAPMRVAIERGGSAVFKVYHADVGDFGSYCEGSLFITKTGVSFKANNGIDTFEAADPDIKEMKINGWVGIQLGAFHIKVNKSVGSRGTYNFAPATTFKAESQLIIRLFSDYNGSPTDPVTPFSPPPPSQFTQSLNEPQTVERPLLKKNIMVAAPSPRFQTSVGSQTYRLDFPDNWREVPSANNVLFAPQSAYGGLRGSVEFSHGVLVGSHPTRSNNLLLETEQLIKILMSSSRTAHRQGDYQRLYIGGRGAYSLAISNASTLNGQIEDTIIYTTMQRPNIMLFIVAMAPQSEFQDYQPVFSRIIGSLRFIN